VVAALAERDKIVAAELQLMAAGVELARGETGHQTAGLVEDFGLDRGVVTQGELEAWVLGRQDRDLAQLDAEGESLEPAVAIPLLDDQGRTLAGTADLAAAVVGDADFLANSYLGNGGNLQLGLALVRWLTGADALVGVSARDAPDLRFELSQPAMLALSFGALFGLPALLLATGLVIRFRRRRR